MNWLHFNEVYTDKALPKMINLDTVETIEWSGHDFIVLTLIIGTEHSSRVIYIQANGISTAEEMYHWIKETIRSGQNKLIDVTKYQP